MQSARNLVGALVELTAGVEHCHHNLERGLVEFGVLVHGNTEAVVLNRYGVVLIYSHVDVGAVACHGLIDGVIHRLVNEVVESFL